MSKSTGQAQSQTGAALFQKYHPQASTPKPKNNYQKTTIKRAVPVDVPIPEAAPLPPTDARPLTDGTAGLALRGRARPCDTAVGARRREVAATAVITGAGAAGVAASEGGERKQDGHQTNNRMEIKKRFKNI